MEIPKWNCHKQVRAFKIVNIVYDGTSVDNPSPKGVGARLYPYDAVCHSVHVTSTWFENHQPKVGGYYVLYDDGYESYSPAKAFEEGYTSAS